MKSLPEEIVAIYDESTLIKRKHYPTREEVATHFDKFYNDVAAAINDIGANSFCVIGTNVGKSKHKTIEIINEDGYTNKTNVIRQIIHSLLVNVNYSLKVTYGDNNTLNVIRYSDYEHTGAHFTIMSLHKAKRNKLI